MELDEHAPLYVSKPQHPEYHAPSDDDIQVEDDDDDPEEDPSEEHEPEDDDEDPKEDPNKEHESKSSDETEPFKEDKIAVTPPSSRHRGARISAQLGHRATMIHNKDDILEEDMPPQRRFVLTGSPPRCDVAESLTAAATRAPRSQYDFVDTVEAGQGLIRSPETYMSLMEWQRQSAEDLAVTQMMRIHTLEARA
nr:hypothetical protein [Tanacetum cinerariifolium]